MFRNAATTVRNAVVCNVFTEKDVNRTDRTNKFYEGLENPGLILLHDILMTYCMYDFDLGESLYFFWLI